MSSRTKTFLGLYQCAKTEAKKKGEDANSRIIPVSLSLSPVIVDKKVVRPLLRLDLRLARSRDPGSTSGRRRLR